MKKEEVYNINNTNTNTINVNNTSPNSNSNNFSFKNKNKNNNKTEEPQINKQNPSIIQRKNSSEKKSVNNYVTEPIQNKPSDNSKKTTCLCYSNYDESFIRNNICRFCNRFIDNPHVYENTIKKKYQLQQDIQRKYR
jgi:hypothetical protein